MFTTALPRPSRFRLGGALAALAVTGLALATTATPASATNEFPAKPTAQAAISCGDGGAVLIMNLGNVGGLSTAHFAISVTGQADDTIDVAPGSSSTIQRFGLVENSDVTVAISADPALAYTATFPVNCFDFVGGIALTCDGAQPILTAEVTTIGPLGDNLSFHVNGVIAASADVAPGSSKTFTAAVPDGVPFTSELTSLHDGTITDLSGTPNCAPEPTTTTTTTPTTTSTSTTTTSTVVAPAVPIDPPAVLPQSVQPVSYVAATELPRTGSSTAPLALLGATLLGLGIALRSIRRLI